MKTLTLWATVLLAAGTLIAVSAAGAEDVGSTPLTPKGSNPSAYCKRPLSSICTTVAPTRQGSGNFVVTVFAPSSTTVRRFDLWSGTRATRLRPKSICKYRGKDSKPEYQVGTFYITRCTETIKPNKHRTYCMSGLSRLPSLQGPTITYSVYVDGGDTGASSVTSIPATSKCPASVGKRHK